MTGHIRWDIATALGAVVVAGTMGGAIGGAQTRTPSPPPAPQAPQPPPGPPAGAARGMMLMGPGASIGATVRDASPAEIEKQKITGGVVVERVRPGSPAEMAGLKATDLITAFDGEPVRSVRQFARVVQETPPGRTVKMTVVRDGKKTDLSVAPRDDRRADLFIDQDRLREEIGRLRDQFPRDFDIDIDGGRARLGVTVAELTPQLADFFGAKDGVLVSSVRDESPAARAGLKAGDVVVAANNQEIGSTRDLTRVLRDIQDNQTVTLRIVRDKKEMTVTAQLEPRQPRRDTRRQRQPA